MAGAARRSQGVPIAPASIPADAEPTAHVIEKKVEQIQPEPAKPAATKKEIVVPKESVIPVKKNPIAAPKKTEKKISEEATKQKEQSVPAFSELKKKYTNLKKRETPKAEKISEPAKKVESVVEKKQEARSQPKTVEQKASSQGQIYDGPVNGQGSAYSAERIEFAVDEPVGSENAIVQEIECHYRRPPGFDDHESFVFTFEIKNGKATSVGLKGTEPLVMYSAIKEAVLKATFAVTKQSRKIELIITSNG